jgi:hypothetical protein
MGPYRLSGILAAAAFAGMPACQATAQDADPPVLARVEVVGLPEQVGLPACAHLQDAAGREYLLVAAPESRLAQRGWPYRILATDARLDQYVLATAPRPDAMAAAAGRFKVVYDDGRQWLVRATPQEAEELAGAGFELVRLSAPIVWMPRLAPLRIESLTISNEMVAEMIGHVQITNLYTCLRAASGEDPVIVGGDLYTILTRHTSSGTPILKATQWAYEHMQALGLNVRYHNWASGRNVIGTQPGGAFSNEIVIVIAHLDDTPSSGRAPGADDNGSGSVTVLTAADIFRQYRFERTIRFVLVTGEEQVLLGSNAYAAQCLASNDNIVAVFNMDMIAWDAANGPTLDLFTRSASDPGYPADLAIASVFTNVVATYGLSSRLVPRLIAYTISSSDHYSFWTRGYPGILAIEDYWNGDFNAYYHTANDNVQHVNMTYFTDFAKACIGALAHLAGPTGRTSFDLLEVANSDWTPGSGVGAGVLYAGHEEGATEGDPDGRDSAWSNAPANPNPAWLKIHTEPYVSALRRDARPTNSETIFRGKLSVVDTGGGGVSCTNRLRFTFVSPPASNRVYTASIHVDGQYTPGSNDFNCVTNLRDVVGTRAYGYVELPGIASVTNGVVYGTCDIGARLLGTAPSNCELRILSADGQDAAFETSGQVGTRIVDDLEANTNLLESNGWWLISSFTNDIIPSPTNFESGWETLSRSVDGTSMTNAPAWFFRLRRHWLRP